MSDHCIQSWSLNDYHRNENDNGVKYHFIGKFNKEGLYDRLLNKSLYNDTYSKHEVDTTLKNHINEIFPEEKQFKYIDNIQDVQTVNIIDTCTTISATFLKEGASFKNMLGYYIYDTLNPPVNPEDIKDRFILFPNISSDN